MLKKWWENRREQWRVKREQRERNMIRGEIETYIKELEQASEDQRGAIGVVAAVIRTNMEDDGLIPAGFFDVDNIAHFDPDKTFQIKLYQAMFEFRKTGRWMDVSGTMVWLYTIHCLHDPELRPLGRQLWQAIAQGFPYREAALAALAERTKKPIDERILAICMDIPHGLEPSQNETNSA